MPKDTGKRIGTTVFVIIGFLGTLLGIVTDLPEVTRLYLSDVTLINARNVWVAVVVLVCVGSIVWLWRPQPADTSLLLQRALD